MNKTNVAWTLAALILGAAGIYAVFWLDDSIAQTKTRNVVAIQDSDISLSGSMTTSSATPATSSPASRGQAQDAVNINPFGKQNQQ